MYDSLTALQVSKYLTGNIQLQLRLLPDTGIEMS